MDRRTFLRLSSLAAATAAAGTLVSPERLLADPYAPHDIIPFAPWRATQPPVRVTGHVHANGRGLANVRVSDGLSVVRTDRDGRYTLLADPMQPFVMVSTPSGYAPGRNASGTVRFYEPLNAARGTQQLDFALTRTGEDRAHAMVLLADTQTKTRADTDTLHAESVPAVLEAVRGVGETPVFGVTCGDIMWDDLTLYPEYERAVTRMGIPFYQVIGNHDLEFAARTTEAAASTYEQHFGPTWYSFDRGEVHYVVLNDVFWFGTDYIGYLDKRQLAWLAENLQYVERGAPVVVLLHIPALSTITQRQGRPKGSEASATVTNREALYRLLEPFDAYLMSGHNHEIEFASEGGVTHVVNGAVCGGWWTGPICWDGTPNGFTMVEVNGREVRWRYQSVGKAPDHQMRVYTRGSDRAAPDEVVANVWAWDPSWTITWFEDGMPRGAMARRMSLDPLSVSLHTGGERPLPHTWVDPVPTQHLFYATPSRDAREVVIEARDRWGRVYRERLALG